MTVKKRRWLGKDGKTQESWYIDINFKHSDGKVERVKKTSPVQTRRGAEEYERQVRQNLLEGSYNQPVTQEEVIPSVTLRYFVQRFMNYSKVNNKGSTLIFKESMLQEHIIPFFGDMGLDRIGLREIEDFKALMQTKKGRYTASLTAKTINNTLVVLGKLLKVAVEQGVIAHSPQIKMLKAPKPTFDFLSSQEAKALMEASDPGQWRTMISLALQAALRLGELIGLQWSDIDFNHGHLTVNRRMWRGKLDTPKSGSHRVLKLSTALLDALKGIRHMKGLFVFCQEDGSPLTEGKVRAPLERALAKAGIKRTHGLIGWHDLRHTAASHMVMAGVPLRVVQEIGGWANLDMVLRYSHLAPEAQSNAMNVLATAYEAAPAMERNNGGTIPFKMR